MSSRQSYLARKAAGICITCGRFTAVRGRVRCLACLSRDANLAAIRDERKRAASWRTGICARSGCTTDWRAEGISVGPYCAAHVPFRRPDGIRFIDLARAHSLAVSLPGDVCVYHLPGCSSVATHGDHVLPKYARPDLTFHVANLVPACRDCNRRKGTLPVQALPIPAGALWWQWLARDPALSDLVGGLEQATKTWGWAA